jgi:SulP family sulfate permease
MKRYLREVGLVQDTSKALAFRHLDEALEWVETQLLVNASYVSKDSDPALSLAEFEKLLNWKSRALTSLESIIEQRHISEGENVFNIGEPGDELLFIRRGTVRIEFPIQNKDTWHIGTFGRGDFIGEMGFLDSTRRSAIAIAVIDTDCFVLSRVRFNEVSDKFGTDIFEGIANVLAVRLRFMNKELRALRV